MGDTYAKVVDPQTGKLLFEYDPTRQLVRIVRRGKPVVIDLTQYQNKVKAA